MWEKVKGFFDLIYEKGHSAFAIFGKALFNEFGPSLVLASVTFIVAQQTYLLDFTDYLTLSMANIGDAKEQEGSKAPKVILLTDLSYESDFKQSSPLDRKKLAEMFENILDRNPAVMAIDLDISPREQKTEGQDDLDNLLQDKENKYTTKIILITPMPVVSNDTVKAKSEWMKKMCSEDVSFAYPDIYSHLGVVTKYVRTARTLGNLAYMSSADNVDNNVCDRLLCCEDAFLRKNGENRYEKYERDKISPISAKSYRNTKVIPIFDLDNTNWKQIEKCDVVFVGGSYGVGDEYVTPYKKRTAGVVVHAANFYTQGNPVGIIGLWIGYLVDFIIGLMCGALFQLVRDKFGSTRNVTSMGLNLILMFILMFALLMAARYLLQFNLWIQPGPMIVGMYFTLEILDFDKAETRDNPIIIIAGLAVVYWGMGLLVYKLLT